MLDLEHIQAILLVAFQQRYGFVGGQVMPVFAQESLQKLVLIGVW
jgi:hypothetical protein